MENETSLAFADMETRAKAGASATVLDRISVRNFIVDVEIGAFQAERDVTQRIGFDVVVEVGEGRGSVTDDVDQILSYDTLTEAITHELAAERLSLLETLADRIADRILLAPKAQRVFLRIQKLDRGPFELGVEIQRSRTAPNDGSENQAMVHPRLIYLGAGDLTSRALGALLDMQLAQQSPVILCVGFCEIDRPQGATNAAQRQIDLLSLEQNAWRVAALDARCVVAGSRTELDWGMKNGQLSVWAPTKIIRDAVDLDTKAQVDPLALTRWLATEIQAAELLLLDAAGQLNSA